MRTVIKETFKTLESLIDTMEQRPLNAVFKGETDLSSQRNETQKKDSGREAWAGTYTYNEAMDVLRNGYHEPLEKMKKAILSIGQKDNYQKPRTYNDFVGFAPNVPNYLRNVPETMIRRDRITPKTKTIHLLYSFCGASKTKPEQLITGGINFISLVNSLEKQGYRVKIDVIFTTVTGETVASFITNLKQYDQQTNLLKLAFPLVHPAMLRRLSFKWLETVPELKDRNYIDGYGTPLNFVMNDDINRETDFLKEHEIVKGENVYYCNVYQSIKAKNVEALADVMKITKG
jgi:hypothetical protein